MMKSAWHEDPDAKAEAERLYSFVGQYVVSFQWMESQVEQIILLANGERQWNETHRWLSKQRNVDKINKLQELVRSGHSFDSIQVEGWYDRFDRVIDKLHEERQRRNIILHAQYIFDFLAIGASVVQANIERKSGELEFNQDDLSSQRCEHIMKELTELAFSLNFVCVQLRQSCIS